MNFLDWLDGKKTYLGGIGAILVGLGQLLYDYYNGTLKDYQSYLSWIIAGWTIIGGRSALNKI